MAGYLILGAGKFGRLALRRLARQDAAARFTVVDRLPGALAAARAASGQDGQWVEAEAVRFLVERLDVGAAWDWIIPMTPVHLAFCWLLAGPLAGLGWQAAPAPEPLASLAPVARRGPQGELYLSLAHHLCPDDCAEPEVCPVTGEPRELPLYRDLAAVPLPGWQIRVIESRQLAPGVGGYAPERLRELARDMDNLAGNLAIATACRCHGVVHGLTRPSGRHGV